MHRMTSTIYACPEHAPMLFDSLPNDDGLERCDVEGCTKRNYAVKPFRVTGRAALEGVYRTNDGAVVVTRKGTR